MVFYVLNFYWVMRRDFSIRGLRKKIKALSIWQKLRGFFLLLSALVIAIYIVWITWEFIDDAIERYSDEDLIPFMVWILLVVSWISYFFINKRWVKRVFYVSWILALFLFAWLLVDDSDNIWRERERERTWYYEKLHEEFLEWCEYCKYNYCDRKVKMKCRDNWVSL